MWWFFCIVSNAGPKHQTSAYFNYWRVLGSTLLHKLADAHHVFQAKKEEILNNGLDPSAKPYKKQEDPPLNRF